MRIPVVNIGVTNRWRFRGSDAVHMWLSHRPWEAELPRSPTVLRLAVESYAPQALAALTAVAHGHDGGRTDLRVLEVVLRPDEQALQALVRALDARGDDPLERLRSAAQVLRRPHVLVLRTEGPAAGLFDDLCALLDSLAKVEPGEPKRGAVCLLDTIGDPVSAEAHDFVVGWPDQSVLGLPDDPERAVWDRYLVSRLAWEAGGDVARAQEIETVNPLLAPPGNDDALEDVFNRGAERLALACPPSNLDQAVGWLTKVMVAASHQRPASAPAPPAELVASRLVWTPNVGGAWRPVPWLARRLLLKSTIPSATPLLRSCLVNAFLGAELLRRALDTEAGYVAGVQARTPPVPPPDSALRDFREFLSPGSSEQRFFPQGCPALPSSAWGFATLGAVVALESERSDGPKHRLRDVRNALAHGAYVAWTMVKALSACERELGIRPAR